MAITLRVGKYMIFMIIMVIRLYLMGGNKCPKGIKMNISMRLNGG